jgi:membrane protein
MPAKGIGQRILKIWRGDIWQADAFGDRSPRGWFYAFLRVVSISCTTFAETKSGSRAADLSFGSLLGLGPLIALAMLVASTVLGQRNPNLAVDALNHVINFVAPQLVQYESLDYTGSVEVNPQLVLLLNNFIKVAQSRTVGVVGALSLIVIVLFLFKAIEDVFNEIWGVRSSRSIPMRLFFYWTILTLGGLALFLTVAVMGASSFVNIFMDSLPFGTEIVRILRLALPSMALIVLVGALTLFYRTIPNTRVRWRAAFAGALVVALLLTANNFLQFLYLRRVLLTKSLFGSLGVIPVLILGLYVFWVFMLVGGQISYAVQNVAVRNSRLAWGSLSAVNRERLSLAVLMAVCRRFRRREPPISVSELSNAVRLPTQVLNECLNRIVDLGFVVSVPAGPGADSGDLRYQPAKPLGQITMLDFKLAAESRGADPSGDALDRIDPIVRDFGEAIGHLGEQEFFRKSVDQLLAEEASGK